MRDSLTDQEQPNGALITCAERVWRFDHIDPVLWIIFRQNNDIILSEYDSQHRTFMVKSPQVNIINVSFKLPSMHDLMEQNV